MNKINKQKLTIFFLQITLIAAAGISYHYLTNVCLAVGDCTLYGRRDFWRPLLFSSIIWFGILFPFLFLPTHYFSAYAKKILWWLGLLFFLNIASVGSNTSDWLDRTEMVQISGVVAGIITFFFIVLHYRRQKVQKIKS